jgi:hypothetical protein
MCEMKKNVYFLCYSRYVIMVAYLIKKQYHESDSCTLILSDELAQMENLVSDLKESGLWERVEVIAEKGRTAEAVYSAVDTYIDTHEIDIFYTSHIMRYASHYFVHRLPEETHIYMFDEGIISLDIINGYREWKEKTNKENLIEFDFSRIEKYFVFFAPITKSFARVEIIQIELDRILAQKEIVNELNLLFGYEPEPVDRQYIIIDADIAAQGDVTKEYENYCAKKIVRCLGTGRCLVKIKPSEDLHEVKEKYGEDCLFLNSGRVPFEVIYLNWVVSGFCPRYIIALPTTLIWNIARINDMLRVDGVTIVSIARMMSAFYFSPDVSGRMLKKLEDYQSCIERKESIYLPDSWEAFYKIVGLPGDAADDEKEWLIRAYNKRMMEQSDAVKIWKKKTNTLLKIVKCRDFREKILTNLGLKDGKQLYLYGTGDFAELLCSILEPEMIAGFVKTTPKENETFDGKSVLSCDELPNEKNVIVLNTAVGFEEEVKNALADRTRIQFITMDRMLEA